MGGNPPVWARVGFWGRDRRRRRRFDGWETAAGADSALLALPGLIGPAAAREESLRLGRERWRRLGLRRKAAQTTIRIVISRSALKTIRPSRIPGLILFQLNAISGN